jgi:hypothetical protein
MKEKNMAFLEVTLDVASADREAAASVYQKHKQQFLDSIPGAQSKDLLIRDEDVQVLHGFGSVEEAQSYLSSDLFTQDVVKELTPLLQSDPEVRVYDSV